MAPSPVYASAPAQANAQPWSRRILDLSVKTVWYPAVRGSLTVSDHHYHPWLYYRFNGKSQNILRLKKWFASILWKLFFFPLSVCPLLVWLHETPTSGDVALDTHCSWRAQPCISWRLICCHMFTNHVIQTRPSGIVAMRAIPETACRQFYRQRGLRWKKQKWRALRWWTACSLRNCCGCRFPSRRWGIIKRFRRDEKQTSLVMFGVRLSGLAIHIMAYFHRHSWHKGFLLCLGCRFSSAIQTKHKRSSSEPFNPVLLIFRQFATGAYVCMYVYPCTILVETLGLFIYRDKRTRLFMKALRRVHTVSNMTIIKYW